MRYAVINSSDDTVYSVHDYTGTSWSLFKSTYEEEHVGMVLIDIGNSSFPSGQKWSQETDGIYPLSAQSISEVKENIVSLVRVRTDELEYNGVVLFKGEAFPRDHDTRDDVVLLATASSVSSEIASAMLPLRVNAINGNEVTIANVSEALSFALTMLSQTKSIYDGQASQISSIRAMTKMSDLVRYIDPR